MNYSSRLSACWLSSYTTRYYFTLTNIPTRRKKPGFSKNNFQFLSNIIWSFSGERSIDLVDSTVHWLSWFSSAQCTQGCPLCSYTGGFRIHILTAAAASHSLLGIHDVQNWWVSCCKTQRGVRYHCLIIVRSQPWCYNGTSTTFRWDYITLLCEYW